MARLGGGAVFFSDSCRIVISHYIFSDNQAVIASRQLDDGGGGVLIK